MSDPIDRTGLKKRYWEKKRLDQMSPREWEALCDGCGKCCLNKIEDIETGDVALTRVACQLLDDDTCKCAKYDNRRQFVPNCISLTPGALDTHMYWLPRTCAYRLVALGQSLYDWHPLISGDPDSVHRAGVSVRGMTVNEIEISDDAWEDHIIEEPL